MDFEKPHEEIISGYSLGELNGVLKRIDSNAVPERYELLVKEIEKRKNGIGPEKLVEEELERALQAKPFEKYQRIKNYPLFIVAIIFSGSYASSLYYKAEVEQLIGPDASVFTFLLLMFGIYFGRKAFDE